MLRLLCLVACFLVNNVVAAEKYIRVIGEGITIEQAKENAFRTAVQQRAGAIVLSERQATSGTLSKDNISLFSAGYVDDFKIIDVNQTGSSIRITLDVLVSESKLLNQVLNTGKTSKTIDGDKAGAALNTFLEKKQKGDKMIDMVLGTYPQSAFTVTQKPYTLTVDSYRNATFNIPYTFKWNYDFIESMNEAMSLIEDKVNLNQFLNHAPSNVIIMAKNPKDYVFGSKNVYKFNDIPMLSRIKNSMHGNRAPRILLEISDNSGELLYHMCYIPMNTYYSIGDPKLLIIYGNDFDNGILKATIDSEHNYVVERASKIEVSVVPNSQCNW